MTNFARQLSAAALADPDRPAVKLDDQVLTYRAFEDAASRFAGVLHAMGVGADDRVGMQLPNVPTFPVLYFGALRVGAVVVPMNPLLTEREVGDQLSDSGATVMVGWHGFAHAATAGSERAGTPCMLVNPSEFDRLLDDAAPVADVADRTDGDAAVIIYTSGTTGTPKGAVLTHANLHAGAEVSRQLVSAGPDLVAVATLPLFHVFGMNSIMNCTILAGGLMTLVPRFDPGVVLQVIQRDRASVFGGVPTMYSALLNHPDRAEFDTASLTVCVSGGSALPVEVLRGFDEAFGAMVLEGYGMSETTGMATFNVADRERKPGSIGVPVGGTEIRLVDAEDNDVAAGEPGELLMRGPFVMAGYWNRADATADAMRGGWLHTGDIATVDEDGYYYIVDRLKDLIIRGGYNIYPRELEEVLYQHPAVREAAVIGVPHPSLGEEVGAAIALRPAATATAQELRKYLKERVAAYKYPRAIWFVDELPKGATGKILKREITVPTDVFSTNPAR